MQRGVRGDQEFQKLLAHRLGDGTLFQAARDKRKRHDTARLKKQWHLLKLLVPLDSTLSATLSTALLMINVGPSRCRGSRRDGACGGVHGRETTIDLRAGCQACAEADNVREQLTAVKRIVHNKVLSAVGR